MPDHRLEEILEADAEELIDVASLDATQLAEVLSGVPAAWERAQRSLDQARHGETIPLCDL